tara:strand:- start:774 stop:959 length:186 start_codon:yes stop_codon:yes gene_type:complete
MSTGEWHGGKGSRPRDADYEAYRKNFDRIFRMHARGGDWEEKERANAIETTGNPVKDKDKQ